MADALTRDTALAVIAAYMADAGPVPEFDDLDFFEIAIQLEEYHGATLPQHFTGLVPPPPYANAEAMADAMMAYQARETLSACNGSDK